MDYIVIIFLLTLSALFSGMTLGFFTLNPSDLRRKAKLGDEKAKKVYGVRKKGNLLLCTLLIGNVAVNAALSIYLGSITTGIIAGITATALIVVFGEIAPQAVFSRYALRLGAKLTWLVRLLMILLYPVCWPIAKILDRALGEEMPSAYSKNELTKIIEEHEDMKDGPIDADEERIIKGALSYSEKTVRDIMTPRTSVRMISYDQPLNPAALKKIRECGHSRLPVYKDERDNIIGILYVKELIGTDADKKIAGDMAKGKVLFVDDEKPLDDLLNAFKKTRNHLFIVINEFEEFAGIVTIEDVLEEIIGVEIVDEFDRVEDLQEEAKEKARKRKMNKI
jgi:metal transporter CNNM